MFPNIFSCCLVAQSARLRFLQRSKSHDEPSGDPHLHQSGERNRDKPTHSSVRTGRIHRKGARIVHSRSPSVSPSVSPRPSYHRRKPKDQLDYQNLRTQGEAPNVDTCLQGENATVSDDHVVDLQNLMPEKEQPSQTNLRDFKSDDSCILTERGLHQRLSDAVTKDKRQGPDQWRSDLDAFGSPLISPTSLEESKVDKTVSDSFVSFSSLDTVVSLVDHTKDGSIKCVTSPLSVPPVTEAPKSDTTPDTPTRRMAVRFPQGKAADFRSVSGPSLGSSVRSTEMSSHFTCPALEQVKNYGSPTESPNPAVSSSTLPDNCTSPKPDNYPRERKQGSAPIQHPQYPLSSPTLLSPTGMTHNKIPTALHQEVTKPSTYSGLSGSFSPQLSPTSPPPQPLTLSGSSSQTSPSHVTSFSSSPNDSPVRKPSFSSSAPSPTRHFSYSSSSTMDSPTHKLFVSYRNSPSHRTGLLTSPTRECSRKTSFSSSSHGSPVRKPSFSSSSESQHQQNYSSTTSSQSSILSSPTHAAGSRGYSGTFSPKNTSPLHSSAKSFVGGGTFSPPHHSPVSSPLVSPERGTRGLRSSGVTNKGFVNTTPHTVRARRSPITSPSREAEDVIKYGRPPSPKMESSSHLSTMPKSTTTISKPLTMSSQIPRSSCTRYSSPPKPSTLKLKDQATDWGSDKELSAMKKTHPQMPGTAPLSSPDPDSFDPLYTRPKVQGLVSRFERKPCGPSGAGDIKTTRHGGPQSFAMSSSPMSSNESRTSTPAARSSNFSPPAYTYTSPLPSSRSSSRLSNQPSPQFRPYTSPLSPISPQQSSPHSPSSVGNPREYSREKSADESSVPTNVYVARCDSSDSLSANESSSLLRDEEKSDSMSSLYYADEDIPDAV